MDYGTDWFEDTGGQHFWIEDLDGLEVCGKCGAKKQEEQEESPKT